MTMPILLLARSTVFSANLDDGCLYGCVGKCCYYL